MGGIEDHAHALRGDGRRLGTALALTCTLVVFELVAGLVAHSLALLADAGHVLADAGALVGALWALRLAQRPSTPSMSYGLKRAEILAAGANGVVLLAVAVALLVEAIQRLVHPSAVRGGVVVVAACIGVVVNLVAALVLSRADRKTLNMQGALRHVLADLYGGVAAIAAGSLILAFGWVRADPIASLLVVAVLCRSAWVLLRASGHILLEGTPESVDLEEVRHHLAELPEVLSVHDLHAWTLTSDMPALTAHVVVSDACLADGSAAALLDRLQGCLAAHFDVAHSTFQLEAASHVDHEHPTHA